VKHRVKIVGCGAVTPVGLSALSSCAAIRAHVAGFSESSFFHQSFGSEVSPVPERITQARVPLDGTDFVQNDFRRLIKFAASAVRECAKGNAIDVRRTALIVGIRNAHRRRPAFPKTDVEWLDEIESELGTRFSDRSCVIAEGHTSVFQGLLVARELLRDNAADACIVGGVDSYLNIFDMHGLVSSHRVVGPSVSRGLIPGEGAAFLAIVDSRADPVRQGEVCIMGIGLASEDPQSTVLSDGHPTGRGLQHALEAAVADSGVSEARINLRISDQNGETYRADEALLASIRFYKTYRQHLEIWHPADCLGDMGAASGAMLLILGWAGLSQGYAPADVAMCESSSDGGTRGGCVIARADELDSSLELHSAR
jgi:3-oxoacyl-[acyl-carrier-protein] synthase-1